MNVRRMVRGGGNYVSMQFACETEKNECGDVVSVPEKQTFIFMEVGGERRPGIEVVCGWNGFIAEKWIAVPTKSEGGNVVGL